MAQVREANCILLWSSLASSASIKSSQRQIESQLLSKHIRLEKIDGAKLTNKTLRNQLFRLSNKKGHYPQIFIRDQKNIIKFIGTDSEINFLIESGQFDSIFQHCFDDDSTEDDNGSNNIDSKAEALRFKKLAEQWYSANNLFKAEKFARKSLKYDDDKHVKALLHKIKQAKQVNISSEQIQIYDNEGPQESKHDDNPVAQPMYPKDQRSMSVNLPRKKPKSPKHRKQGEDDLVNQILEQLETSTAATKRLEEENRILKQQLAALQNQQKKVKGVCYECDVIAKCRSKQRNEIAIRSEVELSQNQSNKLMEGHRKRLNEWNKHTLFLDEQFLKHNKKFLVNEEEKKNVDNEQEVDDMKQEGQLLDVATLYLSYSNTMKLLQGQRQRTEDLMVHCMNLFTETDGLRTIVKKYNDDVPTTKHKYDVLCQQYDTLKQQREHLQEKVKNMVIEINTLIEEENRVNHEKCVTLDQFNLLRMELDKYQNILTASRDLTDKYSQFEENVEQKTKELNEYFKTKWDEHEKNWIHWDLNGIICWFRYLMHDNTLRLSEGFNLQIVEQKMKEDGITGSSLNDLNRGELKNLGFTTFDDRVQTYKLIRALIEKYPGPIKEVIFPSANTDDGEPEGKVVKIPKEYLCPISGEIMKDPVVAYDNKTYERANIVAFIKENKRAPKYEHECDENEPLFRNRQLKTKIEQFLWANPNINDAKL